MDAMVAARRIEFYGLWALGIIALDARLCFMRLGLHCDASRDSHMQKTPAAI